MELFVDIGGNTVVATVAGIGSVATIAGKENVATTSIGTVLIIRSNLDGF